MEKPNDHTEPTKVERQKKYLEKLRNKKIDKSKLESFVNKMQIRLVRKQDNSKLELF